MFFASGCVSSIMSLTSTVGLAAEMLTAEAISIPLNSFLNRLFMVAVWLVKMSGMDYKSQSFSEKFASTCSSISSGRL